MIWAAKYRCVNCPGRNWWSPGILRRDQIVLPSLNEQTSDRDLCELVLGVIELHGALGAQSEVSPATLINTTHRRTAGDKDELPVREHCHFCSNK